MSAALKLVEPSWNLVLPKDINEVWEFIAPGVEKALAASTGELDMADVYKLLAAGTFGLLLFNESGRNLGIVFEVIKFPRYKIARVILAFGAGMRRLQKVIEAGEQWAKMQGCQFVEGWVSTPSRARLFSRFGYRPVYAVLRKPL